MTAPTATDFGLPEPTEEDRAFWAPRLERGEMLIWTARPSPGLVALRPIDMIILPGSFAWLGFVWMFVSAGPDDHVPSLAFVVAFTVLGFYFFCLRFFVPGVLLSRKRYALTSRRAIIRCEMLGEKLTSLNLNAGMSLQLKNAPLGTVVLGQDVRLPFPAGGIGIWIGDDGVFRFERIEKAQAVHTLLSAVQRANA